MREDGFDQLVDGEPITMTSNEKFKFKCCDCGLTHNMVIATEEPQEIGFVVERVTPSNLHKAKLLNKVRNEVLRELQLYSYKDNISEVVSVTDIRKAIDAILFREDKE